LKETDGEKKRRAYAERPWLRSYPEGVPLDVDIPVHSLSQAFDEAAGKWSDRTAIIFYGKRISYGQLRDLADRFATALYDLGVRKGDGVALFLLNCPQFAIAYLGALKIGAIVVPIGALSVTPEVKRLLEDCRAETIVCQDILYEFVERADVGLKRIIVAGIGDYLPPVKKFLGKSLLKGLCRKIRVPRIDRGRADNTYLFETLVGKYDAAPPSVGIRPAEDVAVISYTAGTTEEAKGVMLTHANLLAAQRITSAFWRGSFEKGRHLEEGKEVSLASLPFSHIHGQVLVLLGGLLQGYTLVALTTPDLDDVLHGIGRYRASVLAAVPSLYALLNDYEKTGWISWSGVKLALSVADSLPPEVAETWEKRTGITIHEAYGLTETGSAVCVNPGGRTKAGSMGVPLPGTTAAIARIERPEFIGSGEIGELVVKGPQLMKGYWERADESAQTLVDIMGEMWVRTGDLARIDDDGYFYFQERKRDVITCRGMSIFAREIEDVLKTHPMVKEAAVIGVPDATMGVVVKAVVIVRGEARGKLADEEIVRHCRERLEDHKVPRLIEFRGEIPKTDVGKVSRRELREERSLV